MKAVIEKKIPYYVDGVLKYKKVEIFFISNRVQRDYSQLISKVTSVKERNNDIQDILSEIVATRTKRQDGWRAKTKELKAEVELLSNEIMSLGSEKFFKERFELIEKILLSNGIKDEDLLSFEFWDEKIDPADIMSFLSEVIYKDLPKK